MSAGHPASPYCMKVIYGPDEHVIIELNLDDSLDVRRYDRGSALDQHFSPGHPLYPQGLDFLTDDAAGPLGRACDSPWEDE